VSELKKRIQPVSNWVTFKLKTKKLEPPEIKLKLAPINRYIESATTANRPGVRNRMTQAVVNAVLNSIVDWDITERPTYAITKRFASSSQSSIAVGNLIQTVKIAR